MTLQREYLPATERAQHNLVLLHGWGSGVEIWRPLVTLLRPEANLSLIHLPGCVPGIEGGDDVSLTTLLTDIVACVPRQAVFIGWSLGGQIALALAQRFPERVAGVVTLCSNLKFLATDDWPGMEPGLFHRFRQSVSADPVAAMKRFDTLQAHGAPRPRALLRQLRALGRAPATADLLTGLDWLAKLDLRQADVPLPRLHLLAGQDALVPASVGAFTACSAGLEIERVDGASHLLPLENPDLVHGLVRRFLSRVPVLGRPEACSEGVAKSAVAASFSRAAKAYDSAAHLQREVGEQLLTYLDQQPLTPATVLDLGCGTGYFRTPLERRFPAARYLGLDIARGMVVLARDRGEGRGEWLQGDAEALPLAAASVDLVFSSLAVQWCYRPEHLFSELARVLAPGGRCVFTTLAPGTLHELRDAWAAVDGYQHVNEFIDVAELEKAVSTSPGVTMRLERRTYELTYTRVRDLLYELKVLGAHNMNSQRPAGLTSRRTLQGMLRAYEQWRKPDGSLPATYDVVFAVLEKS
ncbi:MAG: malonyl-ACP O-methyltransferase BioC [Halieaceae bacterium]|nr:malonyl-ACP O-methyltransferase BioC [Halieaceae bacterium]